jgi:membrane-associated phospholipid phosphatase
LGLLFAHSRIMSRVLRFVALPLMFATARTSGSQTLGPERRDINDLFGDVWAVWSSPAHTTSSDLIPIGAVLGAVALTTFADSSIHVWMSTHPTTLPMRAISPFRDGRRFPVNGAGNGQVLLPLSAVLYISGRLSHDVALRDAGLGCAASHLTSAALRDVIYLAVSRRRPHDTASARQISVPGGRVWEHHSFLSGHIANSMACVSYFTHRFSLGVAEPAMYVYPVMVGLGRMADGWHWTSDTMAGAAMGFAIGKAMSDRQLARAARSAQTSPSPTATLRSTAIGIPLWSFSF